MRAAAGFVVVLAVVVGGCGDSGESALTKQEFVNQANAICKQGYEEKDAAIAVAYQEQAKTTDPKNPLSDEEEAVIAVAAVVPPLEKVLEELEGLEAPEDAQEQIEGMLVEYQGGLDKMEEDSSSLLTPGLNPFGEFMERARAYGMKACASF